MNLFSTMYGMSATDFVDVAQVQSARCSSTISTWNSPQQVG